MLTAILFTLVATAAPAAETEELMSRDVRVQSVSPGFKGGCLGGGIGCCLGLGLPGMCVGCFLGSHIENLEKKVDDVEAREQEAKDEAIKEAQKKCEEVRSLAPKGSPEAQVECPGAPGLPFKEVGLGVAGTAVGAVVGLASLALAALVGTGTVFVTSRLMEFNPQTGQMVLVAGTLTGVALLLGGLVAANVVGGAAWAPYGVWWVGDQF